MINEKRGKFEFRFGVVFDGHPDLRRVLLPSDFDGR
jgi:NADH:ubiquinone oxidoreductase subunit C